VHCASAFPAVSWEGQVIEVSWSQSGEIWSTGSLRLNVSEEVRQAGRARVRVVIVAPGSAGVLLVPAEETSP
jgi:hypothetical protein